MKTKALIERAIEINKQRPFVVFGICLGFESIILQQTDYKIPLRLIFKRQQMDRVTLIPSASEFSALAKSTRPEVFQQGRQYYNHIHAVKVEDFFAFEPLNQFFVLGVLNRLPSAQSYIGVIQHRTLPIFGV